MPKAEGTDPKESLWLNCNWNCQRSDGSWRVLASRLRRRLFIFLSLTLIPYLGYQNECNFQLYTNVTHLV